MTRLNYLKMVVKNVGNGERQIATRFYLSQYVNKEDHDEVSESESESESESDRLNPVSAATPHKNGFYLILGPMAEYSDGRIF